MGNLTVIQTSMDAERAVVRAHRRPSIAARIGSMSQSRIGALLLLLATLYHDEPDSVGATPGACGLGARRDRHLLA
jgi:hypothetical protein